MSDQCLQLLTGEKPTAAAQENDSSVTIVADTSW